MEGESGVTVLSLWPPAAGVPLTVIFMMAAVVSKLLKAAAVASYTSLSAKMHKGATCAGVSAISL